MSEDIACMRLLIEGRVQGVWFRDWTKRTAAGLGLCGWVRNRRDGAVEVLAAGPAVALNALYVACQDGPELAHVERLHKSAEPPPQSLDEGFSIIPTA